MHSKRRGGPRVAKEIHAQQPGTYPLSPYTLNIIMASIIMNTNEKNEKTQTFIEERKRGGGLRCSKR
jgi:hypothetical protein